MTEEPDDLMTSLERLGETALEVKAQRDALVAAAKRHIATAPVFRSRPVGFEGSRARLEQDDKIATEDALIAAIARAEGRE